MELYFDKTSNVSLMDISASLMLGKKQIVRTEMRKNSQIKSLQYHWTRPFLFFLL